MALGVVAVIVEDLFVDPSRRQFGAMPEMDPLTEDGALQEANLVAARVDVMTGDVGLLFDLRQALQLRTGNTAVLIARGVDRFEWGVPDPRDLPFVAHMVVRSSPTIDGSWFELELGCVRGSGLRLRARSAEFFVGVVPGLGAAPPDFVADGPELVRAEMPAWGSVFVPSHATFLDRHPG